ncbi:hypothetical protein [Mesorhizobium sp. M00.F.Ca.ET.217.01.1.1]|uniref:hypothetical protein n=1 Tax=Mesorhizobium sp. M00.F.Ca.ET.217.01.1.1 TaxID=2500529 RepID=UPI000FD72A9C|nr:hypothetical protein [Mesorhizobium sp. M00.F.Ca.ET.217.01.1.1]TGQ19292.1 hypothetical protein EN860_019360 [Mesorhizobium sp. M00.F.Ca.ET.217.01.1.1]
MKTVLISAAIVCGILSSTSANACTPSQTASSNLAVRAMHMAVDISKAAGGDKADAAVNALMDLVEAIDHSTPRSCGAH